MVIETKLDGGENSYEFDLLEYDKVIIKYNSITNEKLAITI